MCDSGSDHGEYEQSGRGDQSKESLKHRSQYFASYVYNVKIALYIVTKLLNSAVPINRESLHQKHRAQSGALSFPVSDR